MTPPERGKSESVSVHVTAWSDGWAWRVTQVDPRPIRLLGEGAAATRELAWQDAASVIEDQGEVEA